MATRKAAPEVAAQIPDGMSIPEELERRELRLAAIAEAKTKIEVRAEERFEGEQAEHQAKLLPVRNRRNARARSRAVALHSRQAAEWVRRSKSI